MLSCLKNYLDSSFIFFISFANYLEISTLTALPPKPTAFTKIFRSGLFAFSAGLTNGTYNVYIVATDNAGNTKQSNTLNVNVKNVVKAR